MSRGWSDTELARRVAAELPDGACVNLGIGLPTAVAGHIPAGVDVLLHSENGIIGMGPDPLPGQADPDVVNAGKKPVTLVRGAAIVHQADSFSLIRGGRLDYSILGALQVSAGGDLANWRVPGAKGVGGVGGAMDLAVGAKKVLVMMRQTGKDGLPKLVSECSFPLTAPRCVSTVFTDLGVIDCTHEGFVVRELAPGVTESDMRAAVSGPVQIRLQ
ncbi:3-oxoacid CoA-transferase subunit B [Variovorax sp. PBL-E5]|uniref:3-oxoacid CoA-transferase subunit B n=1 Tax=Variovorax sp. PBL-E5 TaxID=434014 RepID=UPI0013166AF0|nr:3-oxoacid CoA-transferase subunit B [Variovorax sp. PBL-E5]VTU30300.1 3-oxoadipate CoA-transferase subunit B [Variovorax sp. PBL-E5]